MKKKTWPQTHQAAELRRRAEQRFEDRKSRAGRDAEADARRLLHELEVHQLELEIQNDELRAARLEVEAGLKRYTELFDFAPIGYFMLAADATIREVNLAGARLLGIERRRLIGRRFFPFVSEAQRTAFNEFLGRVLTKTTEDQTSDACELRVAAEGIAPLDVRLTAAVLEGSAPTALVAVEDITWRKHAEAALREESRNKDAFLAVLSHELRNPLAPIRNSLFVLARAEAGGKQARRARDVIDRQVTHLTRIVEDLLDATRIAQGKMRLQPEPVELGQLVRRTIEDHRSGFEASGVVAQSPPRFGAVLGQRRCHSPGAGAR
jgi:PAS domain S-box-containing protein